MPLEHDRCAVVRLDRRPEVRSEGSAGAFAAGEVRAPETALDHSLATAFGDKEELLPAAFQRDGPALGIREANPVERLKSHRGSAQSARLHASALLRR